MLSINDIYKYLLPFQIIIHLLNKKNEMFVPINKLKWIFDQIFVYKMYDVSQLENDKHKPKYPFR